MVRIGIIAPYSGFSEQVKYLLPREFAEGHFYIEPPPASWNDLPAYAQRMESMGLDAIIARGGTYELIRQAVSIPVVQIPIALPDLMDALVRAQSFKQQVIVVLRSTNCLSLETVRPAIGYEFELIRYDQDEKERDINIYSRRDVVIVGGRFACDMAKEHNLASCHIKTTSETIFETVSATMEMLERTKQELERGHLSAAILENINDAVLNISAEGTVATLNRQAERLLQTARGDAIGRELPSIVPTLAPIQAAFLQGEEFTARLFPLGRHIVSASLHIMRDSNRPDSALCTFQDVSELTNLESKIRMELHKKGMTAKTSFSNLVWGDSVTKQVIDDAKQIAQTDAAVLIVGESGVGKEMFAQSIHNMGSRRHGPFVAVNCCALSENLLESELFGYVDGAFTGAKKGGKTGLFELSHKGTFFLDEINSISPAMQAKLLRVLQEKEIMRIGSDYVTALDIRIIAASSESLYDKLHAGEFRSDLYYRLGIFELTIPPLRQRRADILPLFDTFCKQIADEQGTIPIPISDADRTVLTAYQWGGNIRELRSVAERYMLGLAHLNGIQGLFSVFGQNSGAYIRHQPGNLKELTATIETGVIQSLLAQGYSKSEVADLLGISRSTLWSKLPKGNV